jgi:hypothetical protein
MKAEPRPTKDVNREGGTATANGRWFRRLVRPHGESESDCRAQDNPNMGRASLSVYHQNLHKNATARDGDDVGAPPISLQQLLGALSCPTNGAAGIRRLVKNPQDRLELEAVIGLWKSLGRPRSVFWRETRVFYNRIVDSYLVRSNVES